jgi:hypothetical protein
VWKSLCLVGAFGAWQRFPPKSPPIQIPRHALAIRQGFASSAELRSALSYRRLRLLRLSFLGFASVYLTDGEAIRLLCIYSAFGLGVSTRASPSAYLRSYSAFGLGVSTRPSASVYPRDGEGILLLCI